MTTLQTRILCALLASFSLSAADFTGAEKLKSLEGKIPDTLSRSDIGIGQKVTYRTSMILIPDPGDPPERKAFMERASFSMEYTKEVVKADPKSITVATTLRGQRREEVQARHPLTSNTYWEENAAKGFQGMNLQRIDIVEARYLGRKTIRGVESDGMLIQMNVKGTSPMTGKTFTGSAQVALWVSAKLPGEGGVEMTANYSLPESHLNARMVVEYVRTGE